MEYLNKEHDLIGLRTLALTTSRRYGAGEEEAEDVAQDVMIRLWQMRNELSERSRTEGLTMVMAKNMTIDMKRKKHTKQIDDSHIEMASKENPQQALEESENEKWLAERIKSLPSTQYTILKMRQVEHLDMEEIADTLGIKPTSVATLLARARRTLLDEIKRRNEK